MRSYSALSAVAERSLTLPLKGQMFVCQTCRQKLRASVPRTTSTKFTFSTTAPRRIGSRGAWLSAEREETKSRLHAADSMTPAGEVEHEDSVYKAATTWDGLEWVGSRNWREYQGSIPVDADSLPSVKAPDAVDLKRTIVQAIEEEQSSQSTELGPAEVLDLSKISLVDRECRFRVINRVSKLTGTLIPDRIANSCTDGQRLYEALHNIQRPRPSTVAEVLAVDPVISALGNVTVHAKRLPWNHKDQQVGRWKVIEQELADRGLLEEKRA